MINIRIFLYENFHFLVVKFSVYLNRRVFVIWFVACVQSVMVCLHFILLSLVGYVL